MSSQSPYFFNLAQFAHAKLFSENTPPWLALQELEDYLKTLELGKHKGTISPHAYLIRPELISIGQGSIIEPGAYIHGPCVIGNDCVVRHGAYVRGNVLTGNHCVIGHDSEIKHAILFDKAHAAHFAYVGDSILGNGVNLGAGVKCANFKLDKTSINLHVNHERIATGMRKFGAVIGDNSQIGCNTVTNPGTLIGQDVLCYPCLNIQGFIPTRSLIKPSSQPHIIQY